MKKYLLIIFIIIETLLPLQAEVQAETIDAYYRVSFGVIGQIAKAKAHLERNGERYRIEVEGEATGFAKSLSRNRREKQISEGHIVDGLLVPDRYSVVRSYGNKVIKKEYIIDHNQKSVEQFNEKRESGKLVWKDRKKLNYYSDNDLLTLYFNISTLIPRKDKGGLYRFKAVGAEKQQGRVEVIVPSAEERAAYEKDLGKGEYWYLTAIIHQKIFASSKGELTLSIGKDGVTEKALLKDVVMFGDILAERIK